ncbi:hypothetical protein Dxin01_00175 [Deinococcus xinjiangensis]|uniref:Uncharacterized protein n=1 Tax=Deinococcus xinjiangensis TaxID=457454 RepID=A0ABP9V595_9DEIO
MKLLSFNAGVPADLNLTYPVSSSLQDTQEFERKRTMSGYIEKPKNRFSENKKWIFSFELLGQDQLEQLQAAAQSDSLQLRDPLGRICILKPSDYRPSHMNRVLSESGELLSAATLEGLVINANHNLYAPAGQPITTPANSKAHMPTLTGELHQTSYTGGNETAFGPVIDNELDRPPPDWNRSARLIQQESSALAGAVLVSPILAEATGTVYLAFETEL